MNIALDAALKPRWEGHGLEAALIPIFKDATMASTTCGAVVPVYEIESRQPTIFTSDDQTRIIDVLAAAFSAPLIFPPRKILHGAEYKHYSDGGLFANNPTVSLVSHMLRHGQVDSLQNLFVISVGTLFTSAQGRDNHGDSHSLLKYGDMVDGVSSASTLIVDRQAKDLLGDGNYLRVSFPLGEEIPFDRADEATIQDMMTAEVPQHIWDDLHARLSAFAPDKFP
jgi:predicted acylesterase/phospholipase RssA